MYAVDLQLVMEVWARGEPRHADITDLIAFLDDDAWANALGNTAHVRVQRGAIKAVVDLHVVPVASSFIGNACDASVSGGKNTRSRWRPEVGAVVGAQYAGDGVTTKRRKF